MQRDDGHVMLVGSVARPIDGWDVEDVLRNCATALGPHVSKLPDGEVSDRYYWINYLPRHTYSRSPDMATVSRHTFDDWLPKAYDDHWKLTLRAGVTELDFPTLRYAEEAKRSYEKFTRLRDAGTIPPGVRFMVALPLIESGTRPFIDTAANWEVLWDAYAAAMRRDLEAIGEAIPAEDLAIQWDICLEVAAVEGIPVNFPSDGLTSLPQDAMQRYELALEQVCPAVPDGAWLGLHLCYGSLGHKEGESTDAGHFKEIKDLGVTVAMANAGVRAAGRDVDFIHMPVQLSNGFEDAYYAPLDQLDVGSARTYLGLIHLEDGVDGALRRMDVARAHLPSFGIATQCGWGRRPPNESIEDLLTLHRELADRATWDTPAVA
jgi:hypothetical protein